MSKNLKISILIFSILIPISFQKSLLSDIKTINSDTEKKTIKWKKINFDKKYEKKIIWRKLENNQDNFLPNKDAIKYQDLSLNENQVLSSLNRSIVFNDSIVGPDVSWLVPLSFKWNTKYKFDSSIRGHSRRKKGEKFLGWNKGDAVGQFNYQFLHNKKTSFGINAGIRSVYSGSGAGGKTNIGEGQSLGFRIDRRISSTEGIALGAEQLIHFDGLTDTGRDIYLTISKALWSNNETGQFPLDIYTFGVATGKMAEGNIKFLCSNILGGSGTEILHQRSLCWAPVFSISRVYNKKFSTFFEYNSKWFLLGSSIIPFNEIPFRGTFAVQLSDHIDNYKLNSFEELKWVFRLSLGF
ncbi:hypothetical protein HA142_07060 [Prochlorococcus marinus str. XMU1401]|uniref:Uncharacterized protein n=1 Tax=Prochlorococcus marinus str. XMU1401 TaxID=2052594 RepID=A0A8I1X107_PROMR|nr:hypothetical protein [Prochlorococcus marinus]MBO8223270.1 hypothetical protein [Prochlorococcus marinus str. XMU1401]MCQ9198972.1 hypothetical protein [Prochlorococcus marinus XMU1429]